MSEVGRIYAKELLERLGIAGPFDVRDAAEHIGLKVEECHVSGFEGALVRGKNEPLGTILVKETTREIGRKNFTIAHEIGHYVMPHHGWEGIVCRSDNIESWSKSLANDEIEANVFAGEFLMPEGLVRPRVCQQPPSFDSIRWVARTFSTSLTASGYRLMDLTTFRSAVIWSTNGEIRWFKASEDFACFVPVHEEVRQGTYAFDCFRGLATPDSLERVRADLWLRSSRLLSGSGVLEHSIFLPAYRSVLTLLYIDEPVEQPEERNGLDELNPEDFTLRRRRWPR